MKSSFDLLMEVGRHWYFQQDNAPSHKSKVVMQYFEENKVQLLYSPSRSHYLSPKEHFWSIIDEKLVAQRYSNLLELEEAVVKEWNAIEPSICAKFIESMRKRVELCIRARGGHFNY
jgi:transposase